MSYTSKTNPPPMGLPLARPDKVFCSGQSCPRYGPNEEKLGVPRPTDLILPLLPTSMNETYLISTGALIQRWHGGEFSFWPSLSHYLLLAIHDLTPLLLNLHCPLSGNQKKQASLPNTPFSVFEAQKTRNLLWSLPGSLVQLCRGRWGMCAEGG